MSKVYTNQYRPISTAETAVGEPITTRMMRDMADSVNNTKLVCAPRISLAYPGGGLTSSDNDANENLEMRLPPLYVGQGYYFLSWSICGLMNSAGSCDYTLYSHWSFYRGLHVLTADLKDTMGPRTSDTLTINSTSTQLLHSNTMTMFAASDGVIHFTLTSKNSSASVGLFANLYSITITPSPASGV